MKYQCESHRLILSLKINRTNRSAMNKIKYGKFAVNGGVVIMLFLIKGILFCYYLLIFNRIEAINHLITRLQRYNIHIYLAEEWRYPPCTLYDEEKWQKQNVYGKKQYLLNHKHHFDKRKLIFLFFVCFFLFSGMHVVDNDFELYIAISIFIYCIWFRGFLSVSIWQSWAIIAKKKKIVPTKPKKIYLSIWFFGHLLFNLETNKFTENVVDFCFSNHNANRYWIMCINWNRSKCCYWNG